MAGRCLLRLVALLALLAPIAVPGAAAAEVGAPATEPRPLRWFAPVEVDGKVFPVLRSTERWLNWRDTYGAPRMRLQPDGVWRQTGTHQGIDIFTEKGAPIVSMTRGTVERVGWTFYSGWRVGVRGPDGKFYFYAHLSTFAPGITEGKAVKAGDVLGRVGSSGYGSEGEADEFPAHLHFGIQASRWENPQPLLEALYARSVTHTREAQARMDALRLRMRLVTARAFASGAPPPDAAARARQALEASRRAIEGSLFMS